MTQFFGPNFQEYMLQEKSYYNEVYVRIQDKLQDKSTFTYESVYGLFCHLSILHNTQATVVEALMKMMGSICQEKQEKQQKQQKLDTQPAKPNYLDMFQQSNEELPSNKLDEKTKEKNEDSDIFIIEDNNKHTEKEQKKLLFKKQFQQFKKSKNNEQKKGTKIDQFLQDHSKKKKSIQKQVIKELNTNSLPNAKLFREPIRKKHEREQLDAHFCADCEKFYQNFSQDSQVEKWKGMCSRHRANEQFIQEKILMTPDE